MGGNIKIFNNKNCGYEKICDLRIKSSNLKGITVPANRVSDMIDEYPIFSIAAVFASSNTYMLGLKELRFKESDRIESMIIGLKNNHVKCYTKDNSLIIYGNQNKKQIGGGIVESKKDHRIAMAFLVLGLASQKTITVKDADTISTSFPNFIRCFSQIGGIISVNEI